MYNKDIKPKLRKLIKEFKGQCGLEREYKRRYPSENLLQGTISYALRKDCTVTTADKINKLYKDVFDG
jgi:hypothetical protein